MPEKQLRQVFFKYLLKPVIPEELEDAVNEAISQVKINEETKKRIDHSQEVLEDYRRELKKIYGKIFYLEICVMKTKFLNVSKK